MIRKPYKSPSALDAHRLGDNKQANSTNVTAFKMLTDDITHNLW